MADLKTRITDDVKAAMRAGEKQRLAALRLIQAAIKQKEVDDRTDLDDPQVLAILDKMAAQRRDSIAQFEKGGRDDLVAREKFELDIIRAFLPVPLTEPELDEVIAAVLDKSGAQSIRDMGRVMGLLRAEIQGRADMGKVSARVKQRLSG